MANSRNYRTPTEDDDANVPHWNDLLAQDVANDVDGIDADLTAAKELLPSVMPERDGYARVTRDSNDRISWGIRTTGAVHVPQLEVDDLTLDALNVGGGTIEAKPTAPTDGYAKVVLDADGRIAEGSIDVSGRFPQWTVDALTDRMNGSKLAARLAALPSDYAPLPASRRADGTLRRTYSRLDLAITAGDSITEGVGDEAALGGWPGRLRTLLGPKVTLYNQGIAGRTSSEIALRQGGLVPLITLTGGQIAADTSAVAVTEILPATTWRTNSGAGTFTFDGILAGIPGTLSHPAGSTVGSSGWTFKRTTAGAAVPIPPQTPFHMTLGDAYRDALLIAAPGRNNHAPGIFLDAVRDAEAMVAHLTPVSPRYLVLSILTNTNEKVGSTQREALLAANALMAKKFGASYVDIRRYMIDHGLEDAGITPTADDLADIAGDTVPRSLLADGTHPNAAGYSVMANHIHTVLQSKGWILP